MTRKTFTVLVSVDTKRPFDTGDITSALSQGLWQNDNVVEVKIDTKEQFWFFGIDDANAHRKFCGLDPLPKVTL